MGNIIQAFKNTFADGPTSNPDKVDKAAARRLGPVIESELFGAAAGLVRATSKAGLGSGSREGQPGQVTAGEDKGEYYWNGSGWIRTGDLFDPPAVAADIAGLENDVSDLTGDVSGVRSDVTGLGSAVSSLDADVSTVKTDIVDLETDLDRKLEQPDVYEQFENFTDGIGLGTEDGDDLIRIFTDRIEHPHIDRLTESEAAEAFERGIGLADQTGNDLVRFYPDRIELPSGAIYPGAQGGNALTGAINLHKLRQVRHAVAMIKSGILTRQLKMGYFGDSFVDGESRFSRNIAQRLIADLGDAGGAWTGFAWGSGVASRGNVRRGDPNKPYSITNPSETGGWSTLNQNGNGPDLGGIMSSTAGAYVEVAGPDAALLSSLDLMYDAQAAASIRYSYNGGSTWTGVALATSGGPTFVGLNTGKPSSGAWTCRIEHVSGTSRLNGVYCRSTAPGVAFSKLGCNGSSAADWAAADNAKFIQAVSLLQLDLAMITLGTNDQGQAQSAPQFLASMTTLVSRTRQARPATDILIVMPPENLDPARAPYPMTGYAAAVRAFCIANDIAFVDMQYYFGADPAEYASTGIFPLWNPDLVHIGSTNQPSTPGGYLWVEVLLRVLLTSL